MRGRLKVFSAGTRKRLGELEARLFPPTITSSPDGRIAYVPCVVSSTVDIVDIVDLETLQRLARLDIPKLGEPGAHGLACIPRPGLYPSAGLTPGKNKPTHEQVPLFIARARSLFGRIPLSPVLGMCPPNDPADLTAPVPLDSLVGEAVAALLPVGGQRRRRSDVQYRGVSGCCP